MLDERERERIRAAVAAAESASGAEIVPVLVRSADGHAVADWKGAALGAWLGAAAFAAWRLRESWSAGSFAWPLAATLLGSLAGLALARLPLLRRWLAGAAALDRAVDAGARAAFVERAVFRTRDATGLLLYVALFERRVRVLADEGVYRAVPREVWQRVADDAAARMRAGAPAEALLAAVEAAGALVATHGPRRRPDDRDELPDAPIDGR